MSGNYFKPADLEEALQVATEHPEAAFIAGGTGLFAGKAVSRKDASYISVGAILPKGLAVDGGSFRLGAGTTFQELLESPVAPPALKSAAAGMATRNIRNRATVGGNLGADKSCASLVPFFLVSQATLACADGVERSIEEWRALPLRTSRARLILSVGWKGDPSTASAWTRYSRTAADLSILTCAVCANLDHGQLAHLRIALGGLGPHALRFPDLEAELEAALGGAFEAASEGLPAGTKAAIEAAAAPYFHPVEDIRGSAAFKRLRASVLLADTISVLEARR